MRYYTYGKTSTKHIESVLEPLQRVSYRAQELANNANDDVDIPDWGYSSGLRLTEEQQELYSRGRVVSGPIVTYIDGVNEISTHQEAKALDFFAYINGKANYEQKNLAIVAALHLQAAAELGIKLRWGGVFSKFMDGPHLELI